MSLIQEALKRKHEEEGGASMPSSIEMLPASPHGVVPAREGVSGQPAAILVVRVACYIIVLLGALAGLYSLYSLVSADKVGTQQVAAGPQQVVAPAEVDVPAGGVEVPLAEPAPATEAPVQEAVPPPVPPEGAWPELHVMGVFARPDPNDSTAVIDGEIEEVGATVAGARLIEVRQNGVVLEYRGEEKFVRVGRTTLR